MKPSIGRIVHYVAPGSADGTYPPAHRAADITEVNDDGTVNLLVKNPTGIHFPHDVPYSEEPKPYTWHWPEREES